MNQHGEEVGLLDHLDRVLRDLRAARATFQELEARWSDEQDPALLQMVRESLEQIDRALRVLREARPTFRAAQAVRRLPELPECSVRGCEEAGAISHGAFSLCQRHDEEWRARRWRWCVACFAENRWRQVRADEPTSRCAAHGGHDYVATPFPEGLPVPHALTQHGLPAGVDAAGVEEALTRAGLPIDDEEEPSISSLSPRCLWEIDGQSCLAPRLSGTSFCARHRQEGERLLAEEAAARPPRLGRFLLGLASRGLVPALFGLFAHAAAQQNQEIQEAEQEPEEEDLSDRPPCVAGDCDKPRLRGHALCAEHLRSLTISRRIR